MNGLAFGIVAMVPAIIGPLPAEERTLSALLCSGDAATTVEIPIPSDSEPSHAPCHGQGCHGAASRKKFDSGQ